MEQCFSLTANQSQPAYKPKKQPAEQGLSASCMYYKFDVTGNLPFTFDQFQEFGELNVA
jgi:hypothetical protein